MTCDAQFALRYQDDNGHVSGYAACPLASTYGSMQDRRVQFKLQSLEHCSRIVSLLRSRGMRFKVPRPDTAHSRLNSAGPTGYSPSESSLAGQNHTQSQPNYLESLERINPRSFLPHGIEAGSVSTHPFGNPQYPLHPVLSSQISQGHPEWIVLPHNRTPNPATGLHQAIVSRPSISPVQRSYTTPPHPSQSKAGLVQHMQTGRPLDRPPSKLYVGHSGAMCENMQDIDSGLITPLQSQDTELMAESNVPIHTLQLAEPGPIPARLATSATATLPLPNTLEHDIPPRRELPFQKRSSSGREVSRAPPVIAMSSSAMPGLPYQSSSHAAPTSISSDKSTASSRLSSTSTLKRGVAEVSDDKRRPPRKSCKKVSVSEQAVSDNETAARPMRMDELLYGNRALAERPTNTHHCLRKLTDAPHEIDKQPLLARPHRPVSGIKRACVVQEDATIRPYASIASAASGAGDAELEEYAAQSLEDRRAALDEFMVQNLENPDFAKLCEDIENCWRKVIVGL